jgi:hypothetical protein
MAPNNDRDIGHKIGRTVDSVRNKRLGIPDDAHDKLGHGESGVPAKPHPSHTADFCAIVFFANTSHAL